MRRLIGLVLYLVAGVSAAQAGDYYHLAAQRVARQTYVVTGAMQPIEVANHGNIENVGFIVTRAGVVLYDTGPSLLYGRALRAVIAGVTDKPVIRIYISHAHPANSLGTGAFPGVPVAALPATIATLKHRGRAMAEFMYQRVGAAMRGTRAVVPRRPLPAGGARRTIGSHDLQLVAARGHTAADLVLVDRTTGVLFTGDLVVHNYAPETPDADIAAWRASLARIAALPFHTVVPGHGAVTDSAAPIAQTRAYLGWLDMRFRRAASRGESAADLMFEPLPARWQRLAVEPAAYRRSVADRYPAYERRSLR